jgi:hypothetical protein
MLARTMIVALTLGMASTAAFAQEETDDQGRKVKYAERTEIDFESLDVQGELTKPDGDIIMDVKRGQFNPLIRLRENFAVEMKQSVDEVK